MQRSLIANNGITTENNKPCFLPRILGNSVLLITLAVALLYSTRAIADNNAVSDESQLQLNEDKVTLQSKVNISHFKMTPDNKKATPAYDTQIGSFSMEDGAMVGHYGDGEYAD